MVAALQQAAEEIGASLPQKLSLPDTLAGAGLGAVGIFSGPAKADLPASAFVQGDTESYETVETAKNERGRITSSEFSPQTEDVPLSNALLETWQAALVGVGILIFLNLCNVTAAGFTQNWNVFQYGWTFNVIVPGLFFFLLSYSLASEWLLIPGFIFAGTGVFLTYFSFSGNWDRWIFLWPLQLFIVLGAVAAPFIIQSIDKRSPGFIRFFGGAMSGVTLLFLLILNVISFVLPFEFIQSLF